jgi:hypothetical protein
MANVYDVVAFEVLAVQFAVHFAFAAVAATATPMLYEQATMWMELQLSQFDAQHNCQMMHCSVV